MSRIGRAPIPLPDGVEFDYDNAVVTVKGPKGELTQRVPREMLIEVETPQATVVVVRGIDKQVVGEIAAKVRSIRPPEPYKGKGIRYAGEYVQRKVGKRA